MDIFSSTHDRVLKLCDKSSIGRQIYSKFLMPWDRFVLNVEHRFLGKVYSSYYEEVEKTLNLYLTEEQKKDAKYVKALKKDLLNCWLSLRIYPPEYFLYEFEKLNDNQRREYISDIERWEVLHKLFGAKVRHEHADKWLFYQMAKPYFHRDACKVGGDAPKSDYLAFVAKHPRFFVKELEGCFGRNAYILEVSSPGIDRVLRKPRDLEREQGKAVDVTLYAPMDGKKNLTGVLTGFDGEKFTLDDEITIELSKAAQIRLHIDF